MGYAGSLFLAVVPGCVLGPQTLNLACPGPGRPRESPWRLRPHRGTPTSAGASPDSQPRQLTIQVTPGNFATENLKVAPQFVEPDPEQLARAKKEAQRLREIYATITPAKLWQGPFRVPLTGRTSGANFGRRRILNGEPSSPHTGVDF